jgi:hypothetical protein
MIQAIIGVLLILILFTLYVIISDIRRKKRYDKGTQRRRTRRPQPKVQKRKRGETEEKPSLPLEEETIRKPAPTIPEPSLETEKTAPRTVTVRYTWSCEVPAALPRPVICRESIALLRKMKKTPQPEETTDVELPEDNYAPFSHQRLLDMGLSDDDAKAFVSELVPQIEEQIPQIEEALEAEDFHKMERLTHSIKGSSTNVGTGGVADVLVDYNTYLKSGDNKAVAARYLEILKTYLDKLKAHYNL